MAHRLSWHPAFLSINIKPERRTIMNVGDKVKIILQDSEYRGRIGRILIVNLCHIRVELKDGTKVLCGYNEIQQIK